MAVQPRCSLATSRYYSRERGRESASSSDIICTANSENNCIRQYLLKMWKMKNRRDRSIAHRPSEHFQLFHFHFIECGWMCIRIPANRAYIFRQIEFFLVFFFYMYTYIFAQLLAPFDICPIAATIASNYTDFNWINAISILLFSVHPKWLNYGVTAKVFKLFSYHVTPKSISIAKFPFGKWQRYRK